VQWGKNAAGEIEKRVEVVNDRELAAYNASIGSELAAQPRAGKCPHSFKVVNHGSINVFALRGGSAFERAGLIAAVENESPLACVLAHGRDPSGLARQMAAQAAYNPVEIARFFEKLEVAGGSRAPRFVSDHPNPGNRMKAIRTLAQARGQAWEAGWNISIHRSAARPERRECGRRRYRSLLSAAVDHQRKSETGDGRTCRPASLRRSQ
jgi:predicted Zn-dependent protease